MNIENNLICKSNEIIEASYVLTINEQRLLLACISQIDSRENATIKDSYVISVEQARDLFYSKSDRDNAYRDLKLASKRLYNRGIQMKNGNIDIFTRWISTVKFDNIEQTATLYFHNEIKPYISQLRSKFTTYRLKHITQLSSVYAIRIYELIVSWTGQNQPYKEYEINDFKDLLMLGEKYKQFGEFKRFVITPTLDQINEHTDFNLEISYKKVGRSFKYIQLKFNRKPEFELAEKANDKKKQHNLSEAEKKSRAMQKQRKKAEFEDFAKSIHIAEGMVFKCLATGKIYTIDENKSIATNDFGDVNKYFLTPDHIAYLLFSKRLQQVINQNDTETKELNLELN